MDLGITTDAGQAGLRAILDEPCRALLAFDYDGTLAPIVDDPTRAVPLPGVVDQLAGLTRYVATVAVVTGRPAQVAVDLADLDKVEAAGDLVVLGHYGLERWDSVDGLQTVRPVAGLQTARGALPGLLASLGLGHAEIEDKGLSLAVHVRRLSDAESAFEALLGPLHDLAGRSGLTAEPGKKVIELRPMGMDKGRTLRRLIEGTDARVVAFTGDDLGDVAAFDEVDRLRTTGVPGLLVCSGSTEEHALATRADVVVDGPRGVSELLSRLLERLALAFPEC